MSVLSISKGNSKMGSIQSISLPSVVTCRSCDCQKKCYARKLERLRPSVAKAYQRNLDVLQSDPDTYWREVEASIMMSRFFRFHVSGDIPDLNYLEHMVDISDRNKHCQILCFTKKYEIVNGFIESGGEIPVNLHIIFSAWVGLNMVNPFSFPEAHVRYRDGSTTAKYGAVECGGNCTECATTDGGCWILKNGEQVIFDEH
jgi:hypothetical protein